MSKNKTELIKLSSIAAYLIAQNNEYRRFLAVQNIIGKESK